MTKTIRHILALIGLVVAVCAQAASAQPNAIRAQVNAANANALAALRAEVSSARILPDLTVGQFLDQTDSADTLMETLERAQQIGGPRWIDEQTCQVKLEISGARVVYSLVSIAAVRPKLSPIPAPVLEERLKDWKTRTFSGTGTSVSSQKLSGLRPVDLSSRWAGIPDEVRGQAVAAARQDAVRYTLDSIRPIELTPGQTVGQLLEQEPVRKSVSDWVESRPVTQLRFKDDLQVEVTISAPSDDLFSTVIESARGVQGVNLPSDETSMERVRHEFQKRISAAIGRASVNDQPIVHAPRTTISLPSQPPMWVMNPLDAEGSAERLGSPLRTKSAAESKATENLRARVGSLELSRGLTIDQAAKQDPQIEEAITRSLLRARVYKVDYAADGGVKVRMTIDSRDLWQELRMAAGQ